MSTWVLLRGLTRGSGHWAGFAGELRERLAPEQVVALDLPGNGALHRLASPARIAALTDDCRRRVAALGPPPYRLLAVSMGAMVAVDWATRDPAAIAGCVLVNTSFAGISPWFQRLRPSAALRLLGLALAPRSDRHRERAILELTSRNPAAAAAVLDPWTALRTSQPVAPLNALRQLVAAARYRAPRRAPAVPMLVLSSRADALVDPRCSQAIATHWGCAHAVHASAGHDLTLDDGAWVAARIAAWRPAT